MASDGVAIRNMLAKYGQRVKVNVGRSAIQVTNCRKSLSVHMPVSGELIAAVSAITE